MCRKIKVCIFLILALMITTSCTAMPKFFDKDMDIYKKIHKKYMKMESYFANATMTVYSNKTENKYNIKQYVKIPDMKKTVFMDDDGNENMVICKKGDTVFALSPQGAPLEMLSDSVPDCTYISDFFALYYKSQESAIDTSNVAETETVILETDIYPATKNAKKAVMAVDSQANVKNIQIYDMGGNLYTKIEFNDFEYNVDLKDEIFNLRQ